MNNSEDRIFYGFLAVLFVGCATALIVPEHFEAIAGYAVCILLLACTGFMVVFYLCEAWKKDRLGNLAAAAISAAGFAYLLHILTK